MGADRDLRDAEAFAQAYRLGEVAGGHLDLVASGSQPPDHRREHQHMRGVCEIGPDSQASVPALQAFAKSATAPATAATTRAGASVPSTGLIGSAMFVRASSSVTGRWQSGPAYGAIAGWRCSGVR